MMAIKKEDIKKILIIRNDRIGDFVLTSALFRELRKNFPFAKITAVVSEKNKSMAEKNKNIDELIILGNAPRNFKEFLFYLKISNKIKKEKYDIGIDLRGSFSNAFFLLFLSRVKYKIGLFNGMFSRFLLNFSRNKKHNKHVVFYSIDLVNKALGLNIKDFWPDIEYDKDDEEYVNKFLKNKKIKKFICIVPDASHYEKQWKLENFDLLIKQINKKHPDYKILLIGSEKNKIDFLVKRNDSCISFWNHDLRKVYILFKKSRVVLAPDGGPMHLAWAAKTNLIAIFPETIPLNNYRPLGDKSVLICLNKPIERLEIKEVMDVLQEFLNY